MTTIKSSCYLSVASTQPALQTTYIHLELKISTVMHSLCRKMKVLIFRHYRNFSLLDPSYISSKCSPRGTSRARCRGCCATMLQKPPAEVTPTPSILWADDGPPVLHTCSQPPRGLSVLTKSLQRKPSPFESFHWFC